MVKTLAPALLAELAKMKSSSSSSSSSLPKGGKHSKSSPTAGGKSSSSAASSSSSSSSSAAKKKESTTASSKAKPSLQKSEASAPTKTKVGVYVCVETLATNGLYLVNNFFHYPSSWLCLIDHNVLINDANRKIYF